MRDGIEWEVRYHEGPSNNPDLAGTRSARGSTIKFGVRVAGEPGTQGPVPDVYVQAANAELVRRLGNPVQNPGQAEYVDSHGFAYLDNQGGMCQWFLDTELADLVSMVRVSDLAFSPV